MIMGLLIYLKKKTNKYIIMVTETNNNNIPTRILNDRKYVLSHIAMDMDAMSPEDFYNHMKTHIGNYQKIPVFKNSKTKLISLQSISGWGVYVNNEIARFHSNSGNTNSKKLDFKTLISIRKDASRKWSSLTKEEIEVYKQKAVKMNEKYLVDWRQKYNDKTYDKFVICDELKNLENIKKMKRKQLLHYMGCIGKGSDVNKNIKNSKMIEQLSSYLKTKFD